MSKSRSIYVIPLLSIFHFQCHFHCQYSYTSLKQTHLFFAHYLEYLIFLENNVDEESE